MLPNRGECLAFFRYQNCLHPDRFTSRLAREEGLAERSFRLVLVAVIAEHIHRIFRRMESGGCIFSCRVGRADQAVSTKTINQSRIAGSQRRRDSVSLLTSELDYWPTGPSLVTPNAKGWCLESTGL